MNPMPCLHSPSSSCLRVRRTSSSFGADWVHGFRSWTPRPAAIQASWWSARPDPQQSETVLVTGAILLRVRRARRIDEGDKRKLAPEFTDALTEHPRAPLAELWRSLQAERAQFQAAMLIA